MYNEANKLNDESLVSENNFIIAKKENVLGKSFLLSILQVS